MQVVKRNGTKEEVKIEELKEIAENLIGNSGIRYNEFCKKYHEVYGKSVELGRKIHIQLHHRNLIMKNPDGKWIVNRNEIPF